VDGRAVRLRARSDVGSVLNAAFLVLIGAVHVMTALRYSTGIIAGGVVFGLGRMVMGVALLRHTPAASSGLSVTVAS
jgi:hypothetical protein